MRNSFGSALLGWVMAYFSAFATTWGQLNVCILFAFLLLFVKRGLAEPDSSWRRVE
jgi:hypothetical protein